MLLFLDYAPKARGFFVSALSMAVFGLFALYGVGGLFFSDENELDRPMMDKGEFYA
jgi:hypothetical protein